LITNRHRKDIKDGCVLVYDPEAIENSWTDQYEGGMTGYATCLTGGVARELLLDLDRPDLVRGLARGVAAGRKMHAAGLDNDYVDEKEERAALHFPIKMVATELTRLVSHTYASARITKQPKDNWSILESRKGGLENLAEKVAVDGPAALDYVPRGRFGQLLTVDRSEIEGYRSIRGLIREYADQPADFKPLNVAVFGPPGAGKSFAIREVSEAALEAKRPEFKVFNLSQMRGLEDLSGALHQVRDSGLRGRLPIAFWDEFDSALNRYQLAWLQYFLAPMQDGVFLENQIPHPIGKAIFVFAGGTHPSLAAFSRHKNPSDAVKPAGDAVDPAGTVASSDLHSSPEPYSQSFRDAKGPDFLSRLQGHVDVVGPNPRDRHDRSYLVRRAILLRSMLERARPSLFDRPGGRLEIDEGVLRAFLRVGTYRHGTRSMESIIRMSTLAGRARYERSDLPAPDQLNEHVVSEEFSDIVEGSTTDRLTQIG
jgi:hypothetical protein